MTVVRQDVLLHHLERDAARKAAKKARTSISEWVARLIRIECGLDLAPHRRGRPKGAKTNAGAKTSTR